VYCIASNEPLATRAANATPKGIARRVVGLSDRAIAWLFVGPTIFLLLAINIFPLIWTIYLSFTNYRANRPNKEVDFVGLRNYERILGDSDIWLSMQATAHFLIWTIVLQVWTFLYQPQIGLFNYAVAWFTGADPSSFEMIGSVDLAPWSIVIVDTWMWTPFVMLICLAGLRSIPDYIYEAAEIDRASKLRQFFTITLPMVLPFLMLAVLFRGIENFKMFDLVVQLTGGGPGSITELASINLKREAFEKWRTGYSSAFAIILFVTVFGLASIYVKALNKVKER